ncbi:GlcNAc-PI de-N-acetylase [Actinoplanes ianthinogenes]|uniref:GlcNAc-PI de-N-acetylase n=1 Tax=Actinoplanes ianthinogenes TaxID=122358 RepID=A0ABM7LNK4_9ACTN|nr:PIG-L deacetylase family protein [Actinoplanes ianthinogenes]BCJ40846.1 GlcNAc-PI de-N-acetylase [Actinoplanes ianthinogenes]GGR24817.1 GlcNAc-PI de-N-acetylase [Actinoplanes ianthinogenes]
MTDATLVLTAHPGDFVWRAAGAIALANSRGRRVVIGCMSFGERGESASLWRKGYTLDQVKAARRQEAEEAAEVLGAEIRFFDAGDYPLVETPALAQGLIDLYREVQPSVVLTHAPADPYNGDHAVAHQIALKARVLAQAPGVEGPGEVIGAPPVFCFEPHQPEQCGFVPDVLLDVTEVWERKREAMRVLAAQQHLHAYYTELGARRGLQAARNSGPNLGLPNESRAEAYMRVFPQVTRELS